jgi:phosphatidylglycerophosphate synthase
MKNIILVNLVTTVRVAGIFLLIPVYNIYGAFWTAVLASVCFFTDYLDGYLARKLNSGTFFGSLYDSVADKGFSIVGFLLIFKISVLAVIPLILEILIFTLSFIRVRFNQSIKTKQIGRIKTVVLALTIVIFLILTPTYDLSNIYLSIAIFLPLIAYQIATFITYLTDFIKQPKITGKRNNALKKVLKSMQDKWFSPEYFKKYNNKSYLDLFKKDADE